MGVLGVVALGVGVLGVAVLGVAVLAVVALDVGVLGVWVLGVVRGVVALVVPLEEVVGVAEPVPPGESGGGVDGEPDVQAETDAVASMARAA